MYRIAFSTGSCILGSFLFLFCTSGGEKALPYYNTPAFTPLFLSSASEVEKNVTHTIGSFSFIDQNGKSITEKDIKGKIHVANFIFTRCGSICPLMTNHMKMMQSKFGGNADVVILSYSVTPWIDDVRRLKTYAEANEITSPNWHLLTGKKSDIYTLARQSYFAEEYLGFTRDSTEFLHTKHVLLIDRSKRIRGIYNGTLQLEIEQLIGDVGELLGEEEGVK